MSVNSGFRGRQLATVAELTMRLESARSAEREACSRYTRLRAAVRDWHMAKATADERKALREVLSLAGCWPEVDNSRTDEEQAVDEVTFVGAHRRMRGR